MARQIGGGLVGGVDWVGKSWPKRVPLHTDFHLAKGGFKV